MLPSSLANSGNPLRFCLLHMDESFCYQRQDLFSLSRYQTCPEREKIVHIFCYSLDKLVFMSGLDLAQVDGIQEPDRPVYPAITG
jgi:hypothetical protein